MLTVHGFVIICKKGIKLRYLTFLESHNDAVMRPPMEIVLSNNILMMRKKFTFVK